MIRYDLILYCMAGAGVYLLIVTALSDLLIKKLNLTKTIPDELIEKTDLPGFLVNYLMEFLFLGVIPSIGYSFFYLIIPLEGIRAGLAVALIAFTIGAVPLLMMFSVRIRLPITYILFLLLSQIIKLAGSLAIIAYLYSL